MHPALCMCVCHCRCRIMSLCLPLTRSVSVATVSLAEVFGSVSVSLSLTMARCKCVSLRVVMCRYVSVSLICAGLSVAVVAASCLRVHSTVSLCRCRWRRYFEADAPDAGYVCP